MGKNDNLENCAALIELQTMFKDIQCGAIKDEAVYCYLDIYYNKYIKYIYNLNQIFL